MFNHTTNTNIDMKQDWETLYPPEQVGAYLLYFSQSTIGQSFNHDYIKMRPGVMIPTPPEPTLRGFLEWVAKNKGDSNAIH